MDEQYNELQAAIQRRLESQQVPLPASDLIDDLVGEGYDSAVVSFVITDLLNHHRVELDEQQQLVVLAGAQQ